MIDFGFSKHFEAGEHLCEKVGTPYTVAPEVIMKDYDEKCDMWCKYKLFVASLAFIFVDV